MYMYRTAEQQERHQAVNIHALNKRIGDIYEPGERILGVGIPNPAVDNYDFELKPSLINMIRSSKFYGIPSEDPLQHLETFEKICRAIKVNEIPFEDLKMILFPFSLGDKASHWENIVSSSLVDTWAKVEKEFMRQFFPREKTIQIRDAITNFRQGRNEEFNKAWERMKGYIRTCPHHGYNRETVLGIFYEGLRARSKRDLDISCFGSFLRATVEEGERNIENLAQSQLFHTSYHEEVIQENNATKERLNRLDDVMHLARRQDNFSNRDDCGDIKNIQTRPAIPEWERVERQAPPIYQQDYQCHPYASPGNTNNPHLDYIDYDAQVTSGMQSKDDPFEETWDRQPSSAAQYDIKTIIRESMREMGADEFEINEVQEQLKEILDNSPQQTSEENPVGLTTQDEFENPPEYLEERRQPPRSINDFPEKITAIDRKREVKAGADTEPRSWQESTVLAVNTISLKEIVKKTTCTPSQSKNRSTFQKVHLGAERNVQSVASKTPEQPPATTTLGIQQQGSNQTTNSSNEGRSIDRGITDEGIGVGQREKSRKEYPRLEEDTTGREEFRKYARSNQRHDQERICYQENRSHYQHKREGTLDLPFDRGPLQGNRGLDCLTGRSNPQKAKALDLPFDRGPRERNKGLDCALGQSSPKEEAALDCHLSIEGPMTVKEPSIAPVARGPPERDKPLDWTPRSRGLQNPSSI